MFPPAPELLSSEAAVLTASAELIACKAGAVLFALLVAVCVEALELPAALFDVLAEGVVPEVGWKVWCPGPKPMAGAKVPLTVIDSFVFLPVMTSLPWTLSVAVT